MAVPTEAQQREWEKSTVYIIIYAVDYENSVICHVASSKELAEAWLAHAICPTMGEYVIEEHEIDAADQAGFWQESTS